MLLLHLHADAPIDKPQRIGLRHIQPLRIHASICHRVVELLPSFIGHSTDAELERVAGIDDAARFHHVASIREQRVRHLARVSRDIFAGVEEDLLRVDRVRRFLTYYLPRAAELAEAYALLEKSSTRDTGRLTTTSDLIDRLDVAFSHYATNMQEADLGNLDIELKLLKSSLDEDLGPSKAGAPPDPDQRRA